MHEQELAKTATAVTRWVGSTSSIIMHTIFFVISFASAWVGWVSFDRMLLVLTTIVSLEAIYLAIFIQMTLNHTNAAVEDISEDVEEMQEDVSEIQEDVDEIQEDVDELQEDVEDISEDVEEIQEGEKEDDAREAEEQRTLHAIQSDLQKIMEEVARLQKNHPGPPSVQ